MADAKHNDGAAGMAWWNELDDAGRNFWMLASSGASPADAWNYFQRCGAKDVVLSTSSPYEGPIMTGARLADLPAITPERVLELKAEAKATREATSAKHTAILAQIAEREGYPSWERLCARAGGRGAVDEVRRAMPNERAEARAAKQAERRARHGAAS